jgi:hypothetical protein
LGNRNDQDHAISISGQELGVVDQPAAGFIGVSEKTCPPGAYKKSGLSPAALFDARAWPGHDSH